MRTGLARIGRASRRREVERCSLCDTPVGPSHRHLLGIRDGSVMCACRACIMLFEREAAGGGPYRLIPNRRIRIPAVSIGVLNVPVGLAFLVKLVDGRVVVRHPGPLGTTESEIESGAWSVLESRSPTLAALQPQVEAIMVRTNGRTGADELWLLPIDDCFALVALVRRHWRGVAGGDAVWREVARFFDDLGP